MTKKKKDKSDEELILNWKTAAELMVERQSIQKIPTNTPVDELMEGGIEQGDVTEFYGEFGVGKSQLAFSLTVYISGKLGGDVVFIDCEDTFKPERIRQMTVACGYKVEEVLSRIHIMSPLTVEELSASIDKIPENVTPKLLIIDGVTTLFRAEYIGRETLTERQGLLRQFLVKLKRWAKNTKTPVVVTNQVYGNPSDVAFLPLEFRELAVGGHTLYHVIDTRIFVRKGSEGKRIAKLIDSSRYPPAERTFKITEKGVEPV